MTLILLIVIPLVMAVPVYLLKPHRWAAVSVSLAAIVVSIGVCSRSPLNEPVSVLGRELVLDDLNRFLLLFILGVASVLILSAWRVVSQLSAFFPELLLIVGLLNAAMMLRNFLISVLLLEMAGLLFVFIAQGERPLSVGAAVGYLIPLVLAVPCLLPVSWLIDSHALQPDNELLVRLTVIALSLGFGILLAAVPFHSWLPAVAERSPSVAFASLICIFNLVILALLLDLFDVHLWLTADSNVLSVLSLGGLLTALVGGALAFAQREPGRLLAYAAISDLGLVLVGLGTGSVSGVSAALAHAINRSLSVLLVAISLETLRSYLSQGSLSTLREGLRRTPGSMVGYIIGGLALGGFPLTNGFATRWFVFRALPGDDRLYSWALMLAGGGVVLGYLRSLFLMLGPSSRPRMQREPLLVTVLTLGLALLCLLIGLAPRSILDFVIRIMEGMSFVAAG